MKGGVGKTTLTVNIAHALAVKHKKRVLLVDIDPQFNASTYLLQAAAYLKHVKEKHTIVDIFSSNRRAMVSTVHGRSERNAGVTLQTCTVNIHRETSATGKLDLVPSTLDLMMLETSQRTTENRLHGFLKSKAHNYDYVLIDCPPTISFFTQAAILASDKYVVPVRPDDLSVIGLPLLERWLDDYTENAGKDVEPIGIVFCLVRSPLPRHMRRVMDELRASRPNEVFSEHLTLGAKVAESVEKHSSIFEHAPNSKCAKELLEITEEFIDRTGT
jgi:chromosome partitioning protein